MFSCREIRGWALMLSALLATASAAAQTVYSGIGRPATPAEVSAWDIDVRPDLKGLPKGSGSVANGQVVWESQCASCHGIFGESNQFFSPLVGGTTKADIQTGRVARLTDPGFPGRTTLMKVPTISTLWDYINRAMPWNAPKTLAVDEVYAVTAYLLNLGGVLPDAYTLSDGNMAEVQKLLPNRNGMSTAHGLWPGKSLSVGVGVGAGAGVGAGVRSLAADVKAAACMKDCSALPQVASFLPDFARNQHGNLADQQRLVGPQRGAQTGPVAVASDVESSRNVGAKAAAKTQTGAFALAQKHSCTACHGAEAKIVGPGFKEIAVRYAGQNDAEAYLSAKIKDGGQGVWGSIPMPSQGLTQADAKTIAKWLASGAQK